MINDTDYGSRMRKIYTALGLLAAGATALVLVVGDADASERHKPKPRPAIAKSHSDAAARSSSGGNTMTNEGDNVDTGSVIALSEGDMPDMMPQLDECTVTNMEAFKGPLMGYSHSTGEMTPWCEMAHLPTFVGEWFSTPAPGENPVAIVSTPNGFIARRHTSEQMFAAKFGRAWVCENYPDEISRMNINCD